jgi:hypothetical protein
VSRQVLIVPPELQQRWLGYSYNGDNSIVSLVYARYCYRMAKTEMDPLQLLDINPSEADDPEIANR